MINDHEIDYAYLLGSKRARDGQPPKCPFRPFDKNYSKYYDGYYDVERKNLAEQPTYIGMTILVLTVILIIMAVLTS